MKLYYQEKDYTLYEGNMLDMLEVIQPNSIDSIVCDPPYELNFMNKSWDNSGIAFQKETWEKCFKVLKSGGYLLAFGGTRTFHRIACAIEDAGFEIRDTIMYLYGSGFPKSMNIGLAIDKKNGIESKVIGTGKSGSADTHTRCMNSISKSGKDVFGGDFEIKQAQNEWEGWGTALKPAYEPIIVARKPVEKTIVDNVLKYGVGGINIDECRVESGSRTMPINAEEIEIKVNGTMMDSLHTKQQHKREETNLGRFPANVIHDGSEEAISGMPESSVTGHRSQESINNCIESRKIKKGNSQCDIGGNIDHITEYTDSGSVSRYFYCAKASKKDRDDGLIAFEEKQTTDGNIRTNTETARKFGANSALRKNTHPTVKPIELMQYLVRLVSPKGATILDCFMGSGSTGKAVMFENRERNANYKFIGIELTEEYLPICRARIDYGKNKYEYDIKQEQIEDMQELGYSQTSIFDL